MNKPIKICASSECSTCDISGKITCHFKPRDLGVFYLISLPSLIYGGYVLSTINVYALLIWISILFVFFCVVETRILCSHCPRYAEDGLFLICWANYGIPKIWAYNPNPIGKLEKALLVSGFITVWGYPLLFGILETKWANSAIYSSLVTILFLHLLYQKCAKCVNLDCLFNRVDTQTREQFSKKKALK